MSAAMQAGFSYREVMEDIPFAFLLQCLHASLDFAAKQAGAEGPTFRWANSNKQESRAVRDRLKAIRDSVM